MTEYLFDASSIFEAVVHGRAEVLSGNSTLELARYELGNVVWKRMSLVGDLSQEEAQRVLALLKRTLGIMEVLGIRCREKEMLKTAYMLRITFYDACYVTMASMRGATLVTEDERLRRRARNLVEAVGLRELLDRRSGD